MPAVRTDYKSASQTQLLHLAPNANADPHLCTERGKRPPLGEKPGLLLSARKLGSIIVVVTNSDLKTCEPVGNDAEASTSSNLRSLRSQVNLPVGEAPDEAHPNSTASPARRCRSFFWIQTAVGGTAKWQQHVVTQ